MTRAAGSQILPVGASQQMRNEVDTIRDLADTIRYRNGTRIDTIRDWAAKISGRCDGLRVELLAPRAGATRLNDTFEARGHGALVRLEGQHATEEGKENDACTPHVRSHTVIARRARTEHLGRRIVGAAAERVALLQRL